MIEHKRFFLRCMNYFTQEEKEAMLKEEWEFVQKSDPSDIQGKEGRVEHNYH